MSDTRVPSKKMSGGSESLRLSSDVTERGVSHTADNAHAAVD